MGKLMKAKAGQTAHRGMDLISMYINVPKNRIRYVSANHQLDWKNWMPAMLRTRRGARQAGEMPVRTVIFRSAARWAARQTRKSRRSKAGAVPWRLIHLVHCRMLMWLMNTVGEGWIRREGVN